jgi:hypothetical protein
MQYPRRTITFLLLVMLSASLAAAPDGYSINSDSGSDDADSLYRIDLATGAETRIAKVQSLGQTRIDVEGLAFAGDGTLYGVDDSSMTLFPINTANGAVRTQDEVSIRGLPAGGGNDFGMTFGCDDRLYLSSVATNSLYQMDLDGTANLIGADGSLGHDISALAAWGNPVRLFGLSNGLDGGSLYQIDTSTGVATLIGTLGGQVAVYNESGLSFDDDGTLWAITDRRAVTGGPFVSQVLTIDTETGAARRVSTTIETGYESLAISIPRGCADDPGGEQDLSSGFNVIKRFIDGNDITPVTLNISCNTGLPISQSITLEPQQGVGGVYEVNFIVKDFDDRELSCDVSEELPTGYTASYSCDGDSQCSAANRAGPCTFNAVADGDANLCEIENRPKAVNINVHKEWLFEDELLEADGGGPAKIHLECQNVFGGDGDPDGENMEWWWRVTGNESNTGRVNPDYAGRTRCRVEERIINSGAISENSCEGWFSVTVGGSGHECLVTNTVLYEGIPTLNQYGLLLISLLMLMTGLLAVRRF